MCHAGMRSYFFFLPLCLNCTILLLFGCLSEKKKKRPQNCFSFLVAWSRNQCHSRRFMLNMKLAESYMKIIDSSLSHVCALLTLVLWKALCLVYISCDRAATTRGWTVAALSRGDECNAHEVIVLKRRFVKSALSAHHTVPFFSKPNGWNFSFSFPSDMPAGACTGSRHFSWMNDVASFHNLNPQHLKFHFASRWTGR